MNEKEADIRTDILRDWRWSRWWQQAVGKKNPEEGARRVSQISKQVGTNLIICIGVAGVVVVGAGGR